VTALQDWLSIRPVDPRGRLKAVISEALRSLTAGAPAKVEEPQLIRRGIERC
jgi:hypothetical protein